MGTYYARVAHYYVSPGLKGCYMHGYSSLNLKASKFKTEAAALKAANYVKNKFWPNDKTLKIKVEKA
jgi:hypothetical protein